jgi:Mg2+ and Co2+ transporter CorA
MWGIATPRAAQLRVAIRSALPGALLAGVMGMNFKVGLFNNTSLFWVVLAVIIAFAPLTIGIAKLRAWI